LSGEYGRIYAVGEELKAHRFSYQLHNGPIEEGLLVCHKCDVKLCVRPDHLFLGTHLDNNRDMWSKGRQGVIPDRTGVPHPTPEKMRGSNNGRAKLTDDDVREIRRLYKRTSYRRSNTNELASKFGVCSNLILHIISRKRWPHVD
jgi:hypothetical protein